MRMSKTRRSGPFLILASGSPRRKEILRQMGIPFRARNSGIAEQSDRKQTAKEWAKELAIRKARACREKGKLIVGMDTLVVVGKHVLGKPDSAAHAEKMLRMLSNRRHRVITGVALLYGRRLVADTETTRVRFRKIQPEEIRWYIATGEPFDKAGAYAIQGLARVFINDIQGCYYNVVGFPLACFQRLLGRIGFRLVDLMQEGSSASGNRAGKSL